MSPPVGAGTTIEPAAAPPAGTMPHAVLFLTASEVIDIAARVATHCGGSVPMVDRGLLEAALYRPRTGHYRDLPAMAAALLQSLLTMRVFASGNVRLAFVVTEVFLRCNGAGTRVEDPARHAALLELLGRRAVEHAALDHWLRQLVEPRATA